MEWERLRVGLEYTQSKSMDIPKIRYEKRSLSDSPTFRLPVKEWAQEFVMQVRLANPTGYRKLGVCEDLDDGLLWLIGFNATHWFALVEKEDESLYHRSGEYGEADLSETLMDKEKSFYWGHF